MSELPLRPLGFGEVLDVSFQLYRRDFAWYTLTALPGLLPAAFLASAGRNSIVDAMVGFSDGPIVETGSLAVVAGVLVLVVLAETVVKMALATGMAARTRGAPPPGIAPCYKRGLVRLHGIVIASLAPIAGSSAAFFLAVIVGVGATAAAVQAGGVFAGFAAALMVVLPGLAFLVWMVAGTATLLPIVVVEGRGGSSALRRAFRLARGDRWRMAALVGVAFVMLSLPSWAVIALVGTWEHLTEGPASVISAGGGQRWLWDAVELLVSAVTVPLWVACHMVLYHDRRVRAEGYDIEAAASALAN